MKLSLLFVGLLIQSFAHAASISCRDTKTFAYGTASSVDSPAGKVTVSFSSSTLSIFADRLAPGSVDGYTSATALFNASDCASLTDCSGSDVPVTFNSGTGASATVVVDTAVVNFSANGLSTEMVKGPTIRDDATIPLNVCSQK